MNFPNPAVGTEFTTGGVRCTVLRPAEKCVDMFGREMRRVWAVRHDNAAEGWVVFGRSAILFELGADGA